MLIKFFVFSVKIVHSFDGDIGYFVIILFFYIFSFSGKDAFRLLSCLTRIFSKDKIKKAETPRIQRDQNFSRRGVARLAQNMADEIRTREAEAKNIVAEAKSEAARVLATARTAAEQSIKEAKQKSHRSFRDQVIKAEQEAEATAEKTVESGRKETEQFYADNKSRTTEVIDWLTKEVMSSYGNL